MEEEQCGIDKSSSVGREGKIAAAGRRLISVTSRFGSMCGVDFNYS